MEIRFNTINKEVERVLEHIDKHNRKFFVETAVLHYIKYLQTNEDAIDLFLDVRELEENPSEEKKSSSKKESSKEKNKLKEDIKKATDNNSLAMSGW